MKIRALLGLALLLALAACSLPALTQPAPTVTPAPSPLRTAPPLPTSRVQTPEPGLLLRGKVLLPDGKPLAGVKIYRQLAGYPGEVVAESGADGYYENELKKIPGDEMITIWAELDGYLLTPDNKGCQNEKCFWRHYYSYEERAIFFTAHPKP